MTTPGAGSPTYKRLQRTGISAPLIDNLRVMQLSPGRFSAALCRIGGVNYEGSQTFSSASTLNQVPQIEDWKNNPATGNAWTDAEINASQFGYKSVTADFRVFNMSIHVLVDIA